ncbi:MAG TPA: glycosyltransferase family 39 protein [Steroidobacteraceae bacterium]|nr:glycosyltransferase family 39 protein [Steroidobacteraceae bacterium]
MDAAQATPGTTGRWAAASAVPLRLRRAVLAIAIGLIIATCVFAAGRVIWRVISTDGGWYSYPGYALSQGRDPDENLLPASQLPLGTPGVRSLFMWENRAFLLTGIDWAWFSVAGHGEASLVTFGVLQWLALAALVGWAVDRATGNRWAAGAAALAALSDVNLVYESLADLRPDIPLALAGTASLFFLIDFLRRRSPPSFLAAGVLIVLLPLIHTTGVIPAAMMLTCVAVSALIPTNARLSRPYILAGAVLAVATIGIFALRQPILDILIPTKVSPALQQTGMHDLPDMVLGMAHRGMAWKLAQERERWTGYFLPGNLPQLLFLLAGLFALLRAAWQRRTQLAERLWLPAGWMVGVLILTATDPHFVPTHLIPLIAMGYVMAGVGWALLLAGDRVHVHLPSCVHMHVPAKQGMLALAALAVLALGLRTAQAAFDVRQGIDQGVSRAAVRSLLAKAFPGTGVTWAVGPTSIWLYVPQRGTPVIIDDRADPGVVKSALWNRVSVLVIDSDFLRWGWGRIAREGVAAGWLKPIGHVGNPADKYCLEAFRVEHASAHRNPGA